MTRPPESSPKPSGADPDLARGAAAGATAGSEPADGAPPDDFSEFSRTNAHGKRVAWPKVLAWVAGVPTTIWASVELAERFGLPFVLSGPCLLVGLALISEVRPARRRRKRLASVSRLSIRDALSGLAEIEGEVRPSEQGLLTAPCSGRPAVWARVVAYSASDETLVRVLDETAGRAFFIDDGSGQTARILPDRAHVDLGPTRGLLALKDLESRGTRSDDFSPGLRAFLRSRGRSGDGLRDVVVDEVRLEPGESVVAVGVVQRGPVAEESGYRGVSGAALVMAAGEGESGELVLAAESPSEARASPRFAIGVAFFVFGVVLAAGCLAAYVSRAR
jgi:hypothetical protein